jgi:CheY-like chemotaxis protein
LHRPYNFISLDYYMPVMTGEEAVRKLRAQGRKDLVIGYTGTVLYPFYG